MRSVALEKGHAIDIRCLILRGTYYSLPRSTADDLLESVYRYICDRFQENCVLDWKMERHVLKDWAHAMKTQKLASGAYFVEMDGYFKSDVVYNKTSLRKFNYSMMYPPFPSRIPDNEKREDHVSAWKRVTDAFQNKNLALTKEALQVYFDQEGMIGKEECVFPDVQCFLHNTPMDVREDTFYGDYTIIISCFSLANELDKTAEELCSFSKQLFEKYKTTNIQIDLNSRVNSYRPAFGYVYNKQADPLLSTLPLGNLTEYFYLPEIGWGNFISAPTMKLGLDISSQAVSSNLLAETLVSGTYVHVAKPISEMLIADRKEVKRMLYKVILPGENWHPLSLPLRRYWEYIPVFEDEIYVSEIGAWLCHEGLVDIQLMRRELNL